MRPAPGLQNSHPFAIRYITVPSYTWLLRVTEEHKEVRFTSFGVGHREIVRPSSLGAGLAALAGTCAITDWQWEARSLT